MLAIAQICWEFEVTSHHARTKTAFKAVVNLSPWRAIDTSESESNKNVGKTRAKSTSNDTDVEVGFYRIEETKFDPELAGVQITTSDLMPTFVTRYRNDVKRKDFKAIPSSFHAFVESVANPTTRLVRGHGPYWEMFWELAVACPVPYLEDGPIRKSAIERAKQTGDKEAVEQAAAIIDQQRKLFEKYDFQVLFDNMTLYKPIDLPSKNAESFDSILTPISYDRMVAGLPLKFSGYIFTQNGRAIYPEDLRGLLIRIKNIAIGSYDSTCLKYETIQGMRFGWLSGEINVEKGLENALNIDRNSFNEVDPHYTQLRRYVHEVIQSKRIFYESQKRDQQTIKSDSDSKLAMSTRKVFREEYTVRRESFGGQNPLYLDPDTHEIVIDESSPYWKGKGSKLRRLERVVAAVNLAYAKTSDDDRSRYLIRMLNEII
jgi:hypothetical protein